MTTQEYPNCCAIAIIGSFQETNVTYNRSSLQFTKEEIKEYIERCIRVERVRGRGMISCATNNQQETANSVLFELGFQCTKWVSKTHHPETKVRLWFYYL